jgi:hypothetical protein
VSALHGPGRCDFLLTVTIPPLSVAISWYIFAFPLLSFPTTLPVAANTMNCEGGSVSLTSTAFLTRSAHHIQMPRSCSSALLSSPLSGISCGVASTSEVHLWLQLWLNCTEIKWARPAQDL